MLKILHVAEYAKGGVATVINELLVSQGKSHETYVLVNADHSKYIVPASGTYTYKGTRSILGLFFFAVKLISTHRKTKPDIVHLHSSFAGLIGRLVLIFSSSKIVYQAHGVSFDPQRVGGVKNKIYSLIEKSLSLFTDATIAISQYEFDLICKISKQKSTHLIENGVSDLPKDRELTVRNGRLLFVGRLDHQKGLDLIIEHYRKYNPPFYIDVIGEEVLNKSETRTSLPKIKYLGWLDSKELKEKYGEYTAVVMPSRWEGFGLVAIEAMRAGTPVISSNRGALPSIVFDNYNGFVFSIENFDNDFKTCLSKLEEAPASFFEANCRKTYEKKYNAQIMTNKMANLYISILKR